MDPRPATPPRPSPPPEARFCLRCGDVLGVGPSCESCGLAFDPSSPATYRGSVVFLRWKYWLPGLPGRRLRRPHAAIVKWGTPGYALFISVPLSVGALLGFGTEVRVLVLLLLCLIAVATVTITLVTLDLSGLFCGALGGLFFIGPVLLGAFLGYLLRLRMKLSRWDQRFYLPLAALIGLLYSAWAVESLLPPLAEIAAVSTAADFEAAPRTAWDSILFYEEVRHPPPLLLRLALPRPVRAEGRKTLGGVVRCVYERGHLVKRITGREEERLLCFEVLEQELHFERDVALLDGRFEVHPLPGGGARVVLTTRYRRRLRPSWLWEPIERVVVGALHGHVLEGMRQAAPAPRGSLARE